MDELSILDANAGAKRVIERTLTANASQQDTLRNRLAALELKLSEVDKLIEDVGATADAELPLEDVVEREQILVVPGAFKPVGMLLPSQITAINSPFYDDSMKRDRYLEYSSPASISSKEQASLQRQVIIENKRLQALCQSDPDSIVALSESPDSEFTSNLVGLDWDRIARAVSQECNVSRTATACKMKWLNDLHPSVNHMEWLEEECEKLKEIVGKYKNSEVDWQEVSKVHGNGRTPADCAKQSLLSIPQSWGAEEDQNLLDAVLRYGENNWTLVALATGPALTATQCATRHNTLNSQRVYASGAWSAAEDELLQRAIDRCGTANFYAVSQFVRTRSRQQCRDRWENLLEPDPLADIDPWTSEEDKKLLQAVSTLQQEYGSIRWRSVSLILGEKRTDVACRTRYELLTRSRSTKSKPRTKPRKSNDAVTLDMDATILEDPSKPVSAATATDKFSKPKKSPTKKKSKVTVEFAETTSIAEPQPETSQEAAPKPRPRPRIKLKVSRPPAPELTTGMAGQPDAKIVHSQPRVDEVADKSGQNTSTISTSISNEIANKNAPSAFHPEEAVQADVEMTERHAVDAADTLQRRSTRLRNQPRVQYRQNDSS